MKTTTAAHTRIHNYGGALYRQYDSDLNQFWVDTDNDDWFDYGRHDAGYGHWYTFDGFQWRDSRGVPVDIREEREGGQNGSNSSSDPVVISGSDTLPLAADDGWLF